MMKTIKILVGTFALLTISTIATAQVTETATISGTVIEPVTITSTNLDLGELIQEITTTIATTDADAAQFDISGEAGKEVTLDLTLDAELTGTGANIPVTYSGEYNTSGTPDGSQTHDTSTQLTTNLDASTGVLYFWVGGEVTPAVDQVAGAYSASLQLDVAYTGQ